MFVVLHMYVFAGTGISNAIVANCDIPKFLFGFLSKSFVVLRRDFCSFNFFFFLRKTFS